MITVPQTASDVFERVKNIFDKRELDWTKILVEVGRTGETFDRFSAINIKQL